MTEANLEIQVVLLNVGLIAQSFQVAERPKKDSKKPHK